MSREPREAVEVLKRRLEGLKSQFTQAKTKRDEAKGALVPHLKSLGAENADLALKKAEKQRTEFTKKLEKAQKDNEASRGALVAEFPFEF